MATQAEQSPERLDATKEPGSLIVAEHRGRYLWAAQLAQGLTVLDAGCGTGYGTQTLQEAGASRVVGVDISAEAVAQASASNQSEHVEILQGDLESLPFLDGEFDMVVCFEAIEHVTEREIVLDELARVLSANGILCISTPNRRVYPPGNPHHVHEYEPEEFALALTERFPHVTLYRQTPWLTSAILSDDEFAAQGADQSSAPRVVKMESKQAGEETFTVAVAARRQMPSPPAVLTLGEPFEVSWWQEQLATEQATGRESSRQAEVSHRATMEAAREAAMLRETAANALKSNSRSTQRLLDVEELLAQSQARVSALEEVLDSQTMAAEKMLERIEQADRVMAALKASLSWRITSPLRALKRRR